MDTETSYLDFLSNVLRNFDDGFDACDRMTLALEFLEPEWDALDQKFLRKFALWTKETPTPEVEDLLALAKFGATNKEDAPYAERNVSVATVANNLKIDFKDAFMRCVSLAALGLCDRVSRTAEPGRVFDVVFAPAALIRFSLQVLDLAEFDDHEVARLALFFRPEIEQRAEFCAVNLISGVTKVRRDFETHPTVPMNLNQIAHNVKLMLTQHHRPVPVGQLAREMDVPTGMASYALLMHATGDFPLLRAEPFFSLGDSLSRLSVMAAAPEDEEGCSDGSGVHAPAIDGHCPDCGHSVEEDEEDDVIRYSKAMKEHADKVVEIADLSKEEAKKLFASSQKSLASKTSTGSGPIRDPLTIDMLEAAASLAPGKPPDELSLLWQRIEEVEAKQSAIMADLAGMARSIISLEGGRAAFDEG